MASKLKGRFGIAVFSVTALALTAAVSLYLHSERSARDFSGVSNESTPKQDSTLKELNDLKQIASSENSRPIEVSGETASKSLSTLNEILAAHGDNDPRLDTELLHLDEPSKKLFRERYTKIPREAQNDRGTIVFLLGRNIVDNVDVQFIAGVLKENPCLSLENCDTPPARTNSHEAPSEVALAYSQAVSIVSFEKYLDANPNSKMKPSILESLHDASKSSSAPISRIASRAVAKFEK